MTSMNHACFFRKEFIMQPSIELLKEIIVPYERLPLRIFYFLGKKSTIGYPLHTHRDAELLFCINGSLDIKIKETTYHLKKDDYLYINPEDPHATICPDQNEILVLQISKDFISNISDDPNFRIENETMLEKEKRITEPERIKELLFQIYGHYSLKEEGCHRISSARLIKDIKLKIDLYFLKYRNDIFSSLI